MHKNLRRAATAALVAIPLTWIQTAAAAPLQACYVYVSPVGQAGWSYQHDLGRQAMEKALGADVKTRFV